MRQHMRSSQHLFYQCGFPIFPSEVELLPGRRIPNLAPNRTVGAYDSYDQLLATHICLMTEDFIRTLNEQINNLRYSNEVNTRDFVNVRVQGCVGTGLELHFDPSKYKDMDWEEEKRFLCGNLVLLTQDSLNTFVFGVIRESDPEQLQLGNLVVELCTGVHKSGKFVPLTGFEYGNATFQLVESAAFYFPYLHVTQALKSDHKSGRTFGFAQEVVFAKFPSAPPRYLSSIQDLSESLMSDFQPGLSASQYQALQTALRQRVALIQGPPGTGKTFLGCKIAEYFVRLKNAKPSAFPGPVLVVAASNHTIREFLQRCTSFSAKVVHAYSPFHEREDHGALQREYDACESWDQRRQIMKGAEILAMTTSRAAYMRRTLDQLDIKIVIVEEAAAVLESHVLACITADSEHIIQMGDHKQLRPSAAHPMLNRDFSVGVSQFERLVGNGADCPMLNEQRRMRPEVADLVRPLYPELTDHQCTRGRPPLDGVDLKIPVCLLRHEFPETKDGSSYSNHHEAAMAVELASYLIEAGSKPESITILTTYRRQLIHIVKSIQLKGGDISKLRVSTVDGYQGEENSVIILSLVRSNDSGDIGFIRHENRACVALSRARDGFFILGNVDCMTTQKGQTLWTHVRATLSAAVRLRSRLPLVCAHGLRFLAQTPREVKGATRYAKCDAASTAYEHVWPTS
ncbi:hypothetical protein ONE63_011331 [Megalurothrips usitatus]|uniref:AAA+ ATPase domain-containing protein n=1 Tax=Megalurothrips usitatus TaxID=439358 RepID=A0AAV7X4Z4_9NEOP|nr:hypothetical protein ONE63_011331 [Megalurothrips usitatus]